MCCCSATQGMPRWRNAWSASSTCSSDVAITSSGRSACTSPRFTHTFPGSERNPSSWSHDDRALRLEGHELLRRARALAHVEVQVRRGKATLLDLPLGGLDRPPPVRCELRDRRIEDGGVVHAVLQR